MDIVKDVWICEKCSKKIERTFFNVREQTFSDLRKIYHKKITKGKGDYKFLEGCYHKGRHKFRYLHTEFVDPLLAG